LPRRPGRPSSFQREVWKHIAEGRSGLLHATTGSGKTYVVWFGLLCRALAGEVQGGGLRLLWLTPMRALSADTARALEAPLSQLSLVERLREQVMPRSSRRGSSACSPNSRLGRAE
jgi:ATP-dependent Lhr-like helicase